MGRAGHSPGPRRGRGRHDSSGLGLASSDPDGQQSQQRTTPRSEIESRIKTALKSEIRDVGIGNERADKRAEFESFLGEISGTSRIATAEGVRPISRATRKTYRQQPRFNPRTCEWNRHSLSAYTYTRTERGPTGDQRTSGSTTSTRSTPPGAPAEPQKKRDIIWSSNAQGMRGSEESSWYGKAPVRS